MSASPEAGGGFVRACALSELAENTALAVEVDGTEVAVVCSGGQYYAIADECSHAAIPLSEGDVEDGEIECYLHGSRFDLRTGKPLGLPATEPVAVYPVRVEGDDLLVDPTSPLN
ncbi:MAG: non-heme iron oxygenase ferredoxin subunit [Friedmanniella sp.]|jgi:3-phenylpropionate/trans-cinnamate dioxygenase ferredoxin subunit